MTRSILILMTLGVFVFTQIKAQELVWPQFRGPNCSGHPYGEARPPIEFGEDSNLKWKIAIPEGVSSPVIWKDHLYLTGCIEENNEMQLLCLNRHTGATIWTHSFFPENMEGTHPISSPAQSTPAVDNEGIYVYSATYGMIGYDHEGKVRWESPLPKVSHVWGHATSPAVMDDKIILNLDFGGENVRRLVALNKYNGEVSWKTLTQKVSHFSDVERWIGYSTPVRQGNQVILHRFGGAASYSIEDGNPLWWMQTYSKGTSTPLVVDSLIYIALWNNVSEKDNLGDYFDYENFSEVIKDFDKDADHLLSRDEIPEDLKLATRIEIAEYKAATDFVRDLFWFIDKDRNKEIDSVEWKDRFDWNNRFAIILGVSALNAVNEGETEPEEIIWMQSQNVPEVPSPICVNGFIYTVKDGGWVTCMDAASGNLYYSERLGTTGGYFSSPVSANGHIYIAGHRGIVHVIKASHIPEIVSETRLHGKILATPAIAGNNLYIRTSDYLYAFGEQ